jgi:S-methylmethionine-dependent homocysteine/selenocysteine methylase
MAKYRHRLPQMDGRLFLTDAGIETTLIFLDGLALPYFAAFDLLKDEKGTEALRAYYSRHVAIARDSGLGFILESATWRSSPDWGRKLGYSAQDLEMVNHKAIELLFELRQEFETADSPMVISGCIGPRGDGYDPGKVMTAEEAQAYHALQARVFAAAGADMVTAITMTNIPEAIGIALAARGESMPVAISFTVETDGRLPTGDSLQSAIEAVDAATGDGPAYYMLNCAHPTHFETMLAGAWTERLRGLRCNASKRSHAELDSAPDLDAGDPVELGRQYRDLRRRHPQITVLGGCCGTDHRHIEQICLACTEAA